VPVDLAAGERGLTLDRDLEIGVAEPLRGRPVGDLLECDPPARTVLDGRGAGHGEGRIRALDEERLARCESHLGLVGEDLDAYEAAQPMEPANSPDD